MRALHKRFKEEKEEDQIAVRIGERSGEKSECLPAKRDRALCSRYADDSSPSSVLLAKSRWDYAAILDVGKYPVPKERLRSSEGIQAWAEKYISK